MLELNLPSYDCKITKKGERLLIWDPVRKKNVNLTPEEWVRQHFINYLSVQKSVPLSMISVEAGLKYNALNKRTDIVVWNSQLKPYILIECKASHVALTENVVLQATSYSSVLKVDYLILTNGIEHYYFCNSKGGFSRVQDIGTWEQMN